MTHIYKYTTPYIILIYNNFGQRHIKHKKEYKVIYLLGYNIYFLFFTCWCSFMYQDFNNVVGHLK